VDQLTLESRLAELNLPAIRYFPIIDSTNDEAWRWVDSDAPHGAIVIADEQTAGRGRNQRHWVTKAGSGLAFSLILHSPPLESKLINRLTGLGAVTTCLALQSEYELSAQIKWPNDILLSQHKVAGVLVETRWEGNILKHAVVGIGINIAPESIVPENLPSAGLNFPATCVESELGHRVDRVDLLHAMLKQFFHWFSLLSSSDFIHVWEEMLAYRDQWVELTSENRLHPTINAVAQPAIQQGKVIGLTSDGALKILSETGKLTTAQVGEIRLKPSAQ